MKKELAFREANGVAVTLYWHSSSGRVSVTVYDACTDELFEFDADPAAALDVFHHPYPHAARRGLLATVGEQQLAA